jgi:hypothetical protein
LEVTEVVDHASLLLSTQRALLGVVPGALRAVACACDGGRLQLRFIFDGPIDPDDRESLSVAGTEILSDFPDVGSFDEEFVRADYPSPLAPHGLELWAYERKETASDGNPLPQWRLPSGS